MSLRYHNLLASMEDEKELEDLSEEETEAGSGEEEETEVNIEVDGDGDVTVDTDSDDDDGSEDDTSGEEEETSEEETSEDETGGEETSDDEGGEEEEETPEETEEGGDETSEGEDASGEEAGEEEPEIEPPSDEGDEDDYTAEIGQIDEDVEETEGDIEETEDNIDQLDDVNEELGEAQEALEAMAAADDVPAYAEKMFMDKLSHISRRTGAQFRMEGSESHKGSKFKDYVFVDSLESSLKDTAKQVGEAIMRLIRQALDAAQRIWSMLTDATRRINARAKKAKEAMKGMDFNKEFAEERATVLVKKHKQALSYATVEISNEKLGFNERLVGELQKYEDLYNKTFEADMKFGSDLVRMMKGEKGVDISWDEADKQMDENGNSQTSRAFAALMIAQLETFRKIAHPASLLPGGQTFVVNKFMAMATKGKKLRAEAMDSDEGLAKGLGSFAQRKGALDDLADFVVGMTDPGGKFTKEFEKVQRAWFREMEAAAKKAAAEHADAANEDKGRVKSAVDKFGATQFSGAAIRIGYSASKDARKAWIKTLHGCNVILGGYASGKAVKSESETQAEAA